MLYSSLSCYYIATFALEVVRFFFFVSIKNGLSAFRAISFDLNRSQRRRSRVSRKKPGLMGRAEPGFYRRRSSEVNYQGIGFANNEIDNLLQPYRIPTGSDRVVLSIPVCGSHGKNLVTAEIGK